MKSYHYKNSNNNNKHHQGSMNISEDITIEKSNKTNKNIFRVTRILNLRYLDLIWNVCIFAINYSNNREIKLNLAHLHAFVLQCFQNYKNGYLGRLICHIIFYLHCQFWHPNCQFQSFSRTQSICCSPAQSDKIFQYHNEYRMLSSFVRTLPVKFHQLLVSPGFRKLWWPWQFIQWIKSFYNIFTKVDQTTRK